MTLRRALCIAACLVPVVAGTALAQAPQQQNSVWDQTPQQAGPPASSPWGQPAAAPQAAPAASPWDQPQQPPPCIAEIMKLRDVADKRAAAIRAANARKASAKEACGLFNALSAAQAKMIKYAMDNRQSCGIPAQFVEQVKQSQNQVGEIRTKICNAAAAPQQRGPTLSDALTGPVPDASNIKTGRGTFDTLTGSPLGGR